MRGLAENGADAYGYDVVDVHRRIALALECLVRAKAETQHKR